MAQGQLLNNHDGLSLVDIKLNAVLSQKHNDRQERGPLVAVNETAILGKAISNGTSQRGKIMLAVSPFVSRPIQRGLK